MLVHNFRRSLLRFHQQGGSKLSTDGGLGIRAGAKAGASACCLHGPGQHPVVRVVGFKDPCHHLCSKSVQAAALKRRVIAECQSARGGGSNGNDGGGRGMDFSSGPHDDDDDNNRTENPSTQPAWFKVTHWYFSVLTDICKQLVDLQVLQNWSYCCFYGAIGFKTYMC